MIDSNLYSYINVLNKAADASWLKQEAISNNIANQDTPGYKRQDVNFESVLEEELGHYKYTTLDRKIRNLDLGQLDVETNIDSANYSYREDGNNVDPEQEYVSLAATQINYNALVDSMSQEISRIKSVLK